MRSKPSFPLRKTALSSIITNHIQQVCARTLPLFMVLSLGLTSIGYSQSPKVIPPSPNAFAFQKYGDIPVSAYTGVPSISIPLYEVKSGDISFPIDVSYHASGIKVADEASKVGLGWVLNSSGMISRSIVGNDDYPASGGLPYHNNVVPELFQSYPYVTTNNFLYQEGCSDALGFVPTIGSPDPYDSQPDQYFYSLPGGKSGKFILSRSMAVIQEKNELIDIKITSAPLVNEWKIRTPDGFVYEFTESESYLESDGLHKTAWYLTKIVSPTGREITFHYTTRTAYIKTTGAFIEEREDATWAHSTGNTCTPNPPSISPVPGKQYTNVVLESIKFKEGMVKFLYSSREDLDGDDKVYRIEIYAKDSESPLAYSVVKAVDFVYEYFQGTNDQIPDAPANEETKRLKLKKLLFKSKNDEKGAEYRFDYHNETDMPSQLPSKLSFARDHWGYYNGRTGNESLIPGFANIPGGASVHSVIGIMGDERDPHGSAVKLFALKKISYPTGGHTEFELESNDFDPTASNSQDFTGFTPVDEVKTVSKGVNYFTSDNRIKVLPGYPATYSEALTDGKVFDFTDAYLPAGSTTFTFDMEAAFTFTNYSLPDCPSGNETITFEIVREDGTIVPNTTSNILQSGYGKCAGTATNDPNQDDPPYWGIQYKRSYILERGKYFVRFYMQPSVTFLSGIAFDFKYLVLESDNNASNIKYLIGGGLRTKRIISSASSTSPSQITRYDYHYESDEDSDGTNEVYSYGIRMTRPNYSYMEVRGSGDIDCETLKRSSENSSGGGTPVGYSQVTVYQGEAGENGKTTFEYYNKPDFVLNYAQPSGLPDGNPASVPRRPPSRSTIPDAYNGSLKKQTEFKNDGNGNFVHVKITTNNYVDKRNNADATVWAVETRFSSMNIFCNGNAAGFIFCVYPAITRSWVCLESTTEELFDQADLLKSTVTTSQYQYNPVHYQVSQQDQFWEGKRIITKYKYPLDYLSNECTPALLAMKEQQSIFYAPVVQKRTEELTGGSPKVIGQEVTLYDFLTGGPLIQPKAVAQRLFSQAEPTQNVSDFNPALGLDNNYRLAFELTYDNGNIVTIQKPDDYPVSYYWGYQNSLPIAEIKNALPSQVFHTSFEDFGEGDSNASKTGLKSSTSGITINLTGLLPGTYVITYWLNNANVWSFQSQEIQVTGPTHTISLTGHIDEVRFYPKDALMTTYTYEPMTGIMSSTDPNNITTYYEYDDFNRLKLIRDFNRDIVKMYEYNYKK